MLRCALNKVKIDCSFSHCNKALDKETLPLLYPLGDFSHTNINISASNLSGVYIKIVFIGAYTKIGIPETAQWIQ